MADAESARLPRRLLDGQVLVSQHESTKHQTQPRARRSDASIVTSVTQAWTHAVALGPSGDWHRKEGRSSRSRGSDGVSHGEQVLKRLPRWRKGERRYSRSVPGDRVQMDVCKIRPGVYQYTAIDDCSRYKMLGVYSRATAANTLAFLARLIEEMPFPIQRIQTDRGREVFAEAVQHHLMD